MISNQEKDGHSIHKLIDFMKDSFIKDGIILITRPNVQFDEDIGFCLVQSRKK